MSGALLDNEELAEDDGLAAMIWHDRYTRLSKVLLKRAKSSRRLHCFCHVS